MAAQSTYTPIATYTLGSSTGTVTFSSIPATYTDLELNIGVFNASTVSTVSDMKIQINSDTGSNYSYTNLGTSGSTTSSAHSYNQTGPMYATYNFGIYGATTLSTFKFYFLNYANQNIYKTYLERAANGQSSNKLEVQMWRSTAAINRIDLTAITQNFAAGSTFTLYGIAAA